ncbi:HAD family hydrolase [Candidatus Woesearchaeota archaeon]|nr:HAD family hydrolase [Candidatus Woesearchaeota archaeon]
MSLFLAAIIVVTAVLALYWVFYGQRKYNDMLMPKTKAKLNAVLFDLDGVLIDSFDAWHSVFNHVRSDLKLKTISKEEFRKNVWGGSIQADAKNYFKGRDIKELEKSYRELISGYAGKTKLLPDAENVLKKIKNKNIKIGLVTNTFRKPVLDTLKFHKIGKYFDAVVSFDDVERAKPYPDAVIKLCEKLNVAPEEAILIGDTKNDYKAGKAAGCFVVGLNTEGDLRISTLKDFLEMV